MPAGFVGDLAAQKSWNVRLHQAGPRLLLAHVLHPGREYVSLVKSQPRGTGATGIYKASREETDRYVYFPCFGHLLSFSFCF